MDAVVLLSSAPDPPDRAFDFPTVRSIALSTSFSAPARSSKTATGLLGDADVARPSTFAV
jgi:hypothetical protein